MILTSFLNWVRAAKVFAIALVCTAVLVASSSPAFAFGMRGSAEPSEGTAQLDGVYQEAKKVTEGQPRGMEDVTSKASQGLNGVQSTADAEKMKSPGDSTGARTVKGDAKEALESALDD
ncbi:MAG: hypothetical protein AAGI69_26560 [Cyanobacteria bacterium P01_H01_bin.21]